MRRHVVAVLATAALVATAAFATPAGGRSAGDCADVKSVAGAQVTSTQAVPAGTFVAPDSEIFARMPAFCRVAAVTAATVHFEVWVPATGWKGDYVGVGNGGFAGTISYGSMAGVLRGGHATASTDTGHSAIDMANTWISDPVLLAHWGHDSIHLMTEPAKKVIAAYAGRRPRRSYFVGGSTGGDQAMAEAEYFPGDYDGIVAQAPGMAYSHLMMSFIHVGLPSAKDLAAYLPPDKLTLLNNAVLSRCSADKAVPTDDYLTRPLDCRFDPGALLCERLSETSCLTAPQVAAARTIYAPVRDPRTGRRLYPGFVPGSEADPLDTPGLPVAGWYFLQSTGGLSLAGVFAQPLFGRAVFGDPHWDWTRFDFHHDVAAVESHLGPVIEAMSPDLRLFAARGGKLIMTQGWSDGLNAQTLPIEYYDRVVRQMGGPDRTRSFFRLFMQPGVGHVVGGPGLDYYDPIGPISAWVEGGLAPATITAAKLINPTDPASGARATRPLCPYPEVTTYNGHGATNTATSFHCALDR